MQYLLQKLKVSPSILFESRLLNDVFLFTDSLPTPPAQTALRHPFFSSPLPRWLTTRRLQPVSCWCNWTGPYIRPGEDPRSHLGSNVQNPEVWGCGRSLGPVTNREQKPKHRCILSYFPSRELRDAHTSTPSPKGSRDSGLGQRPSQ